MEHHQMAIEAPGRAEMRLDRKGAGRPQELVPVLGDFAHQPPSSTRSRAGSRSRGGAAARLLGMLFGRRTLPRGPTLNRIEQKYRDKGDMRVGIFAGARYASAAPPSVRYFSVSVQTPSQSSG